jgi:hypothetical protein
MDYLHQSCKHILHICMASGYLSPIIHWCRGCVWLQSEVLASPPIVFMWNNFPNALQCRSGHRESGIWERGSHSSTWLVNLKWEKFYLLHEGTFLECVQSIWDFWWSVWMVSRLICNNKRWRWGSCARLEGIWLKMSTFALDGYHWSVLHPNNSTPTAISQWKGRWGGPQS